MVAIPYRRGLAILLGSLAFIASHHPLEHALGLEPNTMLVAAPLAPTVSADAVPFAVIRWQVDGQLPVDQVGIMAYTFCTNVADGITGETVVVDGGASHNIVKYQAAIDAHHQSPMMARLAALREQYDLHMTAERYQSIDAPDTDARFLRK